MLECTAMLFYIWKKLTKICHHHFSMRDIQLHFYMYVFINHYDPFNICALVILWIIYPQKTLNYSNRRLISQLCYFISNKS